MSSCLVVYSADFKIILRGFFLHLHNLQGHRLHLSRSGIFLGQKLVSPLFEMKMLKFLEETPFYHRLFAYREVFFLIFLRAYDPLFECSA
jgi:hypothetical protein